MTDVHGEPQQGGYLPAEIWHAYMSSVIENKPCVPFPTPKETITYEPFFGHYAATGRIEALRTFESAPSKSAPKKSRHHGAGSAPDRESGGVQPATPVVPSPTPAPTAPAAPSPPAGPTVTETGGAAAGWKHRQVTPSRAARW